MTEIAWLADFQRAFSEAIRWPLATGQGRLQSRIPADKGPALTIKASAHGDAASRLALYNEQYWFRLFNAMQGALPLTARLLGLWSFNQIVQDFLGAKPPSHYDLNRLTEGFGTFLMTLPASIPLAGGVKPLPRRILREAFAIDDAYQQVFYAPPQKIWRPTAEELPHLPRQKLIASKAFVLVEERSPLLRLRRELLAGRYPGEAALPCPADSQSSQHWAIYRSSQGVLAKALSSFEAQLCQLLLAHPLEEAMMKLEESQSEDLPALARSLMSWLSQSLADGFWTGAEEP